MMHHAGEVARKFEAKVLSSVVPPAPVMCSRSESDQFSNVVPTAQSNTAGRPVRELEVNVAILRRVRELLDKNNLRPKEST